MKNIIMSIGLLTTITSIFTVVSCNSSTKSQLELYRETIKDQEFDNRDKLIDIAKITIKKYEAKIVRWIDGDTLKVELLNNVKINNKNIFNVRVAFIDTPESHIKNNDGKFVDTTGEEKNWADKAQQFASKILPINSEIILITNGTQSYNRIVGSIFFNPINNKYKSFSVEMLKNGNALPTIQEKAVKAWNETTIIHAIALQIADSYNYAIKNKKGLFSINYKKVLKVHGDTADTSLWWRIGNPQTPEDKNIYDYYYKRKSIEGMG